MVACAVSSVWNGLRPGHPASPAEGAAASATLGLAVTGAAVTGAAVAAAVVAATDVVARAAATRIARAVSMVFAWAASAAAASVADCA